MFPESKLSQEQNQKARNKKCLVLALPPVWARLWAGECHSHRPRSFLKLGGFQGTRGLGQASLYSTGLLREPKKRCHQV